MLKLKLTIGLIELPKTLISRLSGLTTLAGLIIVWNGLKPIKMLFLTTSMVWTTLPITQLNQMLLIFKLPTMNGLPHKHMPKQLIKMVKIAKLVLNLQINGYQQLNHQLLLKQLTAVHTENFTAKPRLDWLLLKDGFLLTKKSPLTIGTQTQLMLPTLRFTNSGVLTPLSTLTPKLMHKNFKKQSLHNTLLPFQLLKKLPLLLKKSPLIKLVQLLLLRKSGQMPMMLTKLLTLKWPSLKDGFPKVKPTLLPIPPLLIIHINSHGPRHKKNLILPLTPKPLTLGLLLKKLVNHAIPLLIRRHLHAKHFPNLLPPLKRTYLPSKPLLLLSRRKSRLRKPLLPRRTILLPKVPRKISTPRLTLPLILQQQPNPPLRKLFLISRLLTLKLLPPLLQTRRLNQLINVPLLLTKPRIHAKLLSLMNQHSKQPLLPPLLIMLMLKKNMKRNTDPQEPLVSSLVASPVLSSLVEELPGTSVTGKMRPLSMMSTAPWLTTKCEQVCEEFPHANLAI